MLGLEFGSLLAVGVGVSLALIMVFLMVNLYVKCGPNEAMIISGLYAGTNGGPGMKIIVGGGAIALPMVQQVSRISLESRVVRAKLQGPLTTSDGVPLTLQVSVQIKVKGDEVSIATAAENLLSRDVGEIDAAIESIVLSGLRSAVANMTAKQIKNGELPDSELLIQSVVSPLSKMGITCIAFAVEDVRETALTSDAARIGVGTQSVEAKSIAAGGADLPTSISSEQTIEGASLFNLAAEYERDMPILEQALGEQSIVFKEFLLRFATILAASDDYLSREKAEQLRDRAKKILP
ncbi:hypothetical protein BH10CYA1_BH10CYA1_59320 [soil metagenome]